MYPLKIVNKLLLNIYICTNRFIRTGLVLGTRSCFEFLIIKVKNWIY